MEIEPSSNFLINVSDYEGHILAIFILKILWFGKKLFYKFNDQRVKITNISARRRENFWQMFRELNEVSDASKKHHMIS